jgi:hypothetical protein
VDAKVLTAGLHERYPLHGAVEHLSEFLLGPACLAP